MLRKFREKQAAQKQATVNGLPVIQAGVSLPNGRVFAWTSQGNYEVSRDAYKQGLARMDCVVSLEGAIPRTDDYWPKIT